MSQDSSRTSRSHTACRFVCVRHGGLRLSVAICVSLGAACTGSVSAVYHFPTTLGRWLTGGWRQPRNEGPDPLLEGGVGAIAFDDEEDEPHTSWTRRPKAKDQKAAAEEWLPELDDDFASEASEFDTLDELKEDLKKAASQDAEGRQATAARDAFIAKLEEGLEIPVPKGVKAEMVEQQLKNVTADPSKATDEQKADAEKQVVKELTDQMVLDALAEKLDVKVSQGEVFNFLASIAQQYGMDPNAFIRAIIRNGQIGSAVQEVGRSKGLLSGMRAVTFKSEGETLDLSAFLGEAAEDEESESVEAASAAAAVADELAKKDDENTADAE